MRGSALIAAGLVAAAVAPAAADPCTVDMVRVPDDVRPVIERWVSAEPSCRVHLSVRVLPTEGGYYVLATDSAGAVRERMVPDATTAAVLIASWVADDGGTAHAPTPMPSPSPSPTPTPSPTPSPTPAASAPVTPVWAQGNPPVTPPWAQTSPPVRPQWAQASPPVKPSWAAPPAGPGAVAPVAPGAAPTAQVDAGAPQPHPAAELHRLVSLGVSMHEHGGGLRGEIDLFKRWHLRFGLVGGWLHTESYDQYRDLALDDVLVAVSAGNELRSGRFDVRATVGVGVAITTGTHMNTGSIDSSISPYGDAAVSVGARMTSRLELRAGLDVAYMPQRINNGEWYWDRGQVPQIFVALGFRTQ